MIHNDEGQGRCPPPCATPWPLDQHRLRPTGDPGGCPAVAATARALGITSAFYSPRSNRSAPLTRWARWTSSPLDMASAYGVFAAHGCARAHAHPRDRRPQWQGAGRQHPSSAGDHQVIPANVADNVTDVSRGPFTPPTAPHTAKDSTVLRPVKRGPPATTPTPGLWLRPPCPLRCGWATRERQRHHRLSGNREAFKDRLAHATEPSKKKKGVNCWILSSWRRKRNSSTGVDFRKRIQSEFKNAKALVAIVGSTGRAKQSGPAKIQDRLVRLVLRDYSALAHL